ncbi:MAG: sugar phosphate isomerase/epimerase family protein [Eubacteriales bacterium]|nr:sugar phosphate isomerase/epimerase family protein [Eubacteriales bacterium]
MKITAITNGISGDYEESCRILKETGISYAEIQHVDGIQDPTLCSGEKRSVPGVPVETLVAEEAYRLKEISDRYGIQPAIITSHAFCGVPIRSTECGDAVYELHMKLLKNAIFFAKVLGAPLVRVMCFAKQPVTFGDHGAREWLANDNTVWDKLLTLYRPIVELAEAEEMDLVVENGNGQICSSYLMRKLADDLGSSRIKYLWDLSNAMYYGEMPTLETYEMIRDILAHIHVKDAELSISRSYMGIREIGTGQLGPYLEPLAQALRRDGYEGCISLENIYCPDGGTCLDGYRIDIRHLQEIFN